MRLIARVRILALASFPPSPPVRLFGRLLEMLDTNHFGPPCVSRVREQHHQAVVG